RELSLQVVHFSPGASHVVAVTSLAGALLRQSATLTYNAGATTIPWTAHQGSQEACMSMGLRVLTGALVCTLVPSFDALAQDRIRFDVTPMVGYRAGGEFDDVDPESTGGDSLDLDAGSTFGIDLGLYRDSHSFYEILYSRQESGIDSPDPVIGSVDVA